MASPLLGYNTNVRHLGKVFHIQTEDSGTSHAHIFTHLFADGGRIIATKKTTYAHWIGTERYPGVVKKLMQAQHKAMFIALRDGLFDEDEVAGAKAFSEREIVIEDDATQPTSTADARRTTSSQTLQAAPPGSAPIDVDALERAAAALGGPAADFGAGTPPPAVRAQPTPPAAPASPSRARLDPTPVAAISTGARKPSSAGTPAARARYQETQSAAPPSARPRVPAAKTVDSVFGGDILSEKSLDEVILSYLAEDLDEKE